MADPIVDNARDVARHTLKNLMLGKFKLKVPMSVLDLTIQVIYMEGCRYNTKMALSRMRKLYDAIDDSDYKAESADRVWIIRNTLDKLLKLNVFNPDIIRYEVGQLSDADPERLKILDTLIAKKERKPISDATQRYIYSFSENVLMHGYACAYKEAMQKLTDCIDPSNPASYAEVEDDLELMARTVLHVKEKSKMLENRKVFSLQEDIFNEVVTDTVMAAKQQSSKFYTGCRALNRMLGGGFFNKRTYYFIAVPGGGKSKMLLDCALWIKKYNKIKDASKGRPTIVFVTMENEIDETVMRAFNITTSDRNIADFTPDEAIKELREKGNLRLNSDEDFDIYIRYYKHKEIDTVDLYTLLDELRDEGRDPKVLLLDYIKRIRPAIKGRDEKEDLKNVTDDLKDFAIANNMPVISAHQLNRGAVEIIKDAKRNGRHDLVDEIGANNIGTAWEVNENADAIMYLQDEEKDGINYVGVKLGKLRYSATIDESTPSNYVIGDTVMKFFQPYDGDSTIKLIEDCGSERIAAKFTLRDIDGLADNSKADTHQGNAALSAAKQAFDRNSKADFTAQKIKNATKEMAKKKMDAMIKKPDASLDDFNPGVHGETVTQYEKYINVIPDIDIDDPNSDTSDDTTYYNTNAKIKPNLNEEEMECIAIVKDKPRYNRTYSADLNEGFFNYSGHGKRNITKVCEMYDSDGGIVPSISDDMDGFDKVKAELNTERYMLRGIIANQINENNLENLNYGLDKDEMVTKDSILNEVLKELSVDKHKIELFGGNPERLKTIEAGTYQMKYQIPEDVNLEGRSDTVILTVPENSEPLINSVPQSKIFHDIYNIPVLLNGNPVVDGNPFEGRSDLEEEELIEAEMAV